MGSRLEKTSREVSKRINQHKFEDEKGEEYEGSAFGGFGDYFRRKKIKLQNLDSELRANSNNPTIFKGVVAYVNGYTQPSLNDLHKMIVTHGGGFLQYLDGKTMATHIIASSLTPKKVVEFKNYRMVKPAWVVDSIKAGRVLPWNSYRVVDEGPGQRVIAFDNGKVVAQVNAPKKGYREQTDASWYTAQLESVDQRGTSGQMDEELASQHSDVDVKVNDSKVKSSPFHSSSVGQEHGANKNKDGPSSQSDYGEEPSWPSEPQNELKTPDITHSDVESQIPAKRKPSESPEPPSKKPKLTAEEFNARLLADPQVRKSTVVNPGFLEQFYRESRLHHLSTWKADLKSEMQALADAQTDSQKTRQKRPPGSRRYIIHVDFDCFFAAVSLKKHPQFKDKPTAVAHGTGPGSEAASCNYVARTFGVKNGMWMKRALELCPELKVLPYDFPAYEEASRAFYETIIATGGVVQSVSVDEALVDITNVCLRDAKTNGISRGEGSVEREQHEADRIAQLLREDVKSKTDCDVSVGIGGNILLAKLALRKAKPAGQHQIRQEEVLEFIGPLQVEDLPGVAHSIGGKLEQLGIKYIRDIRDIPKERLVNSVGPKTGQKLWDYSRGIDHKEVGEVEIRKSVSAEISWGVRFENQEQVDEFMGNLSDELHKRLTKEHVKGKQLTLKVMKRAAHAPMDTAKHLGHGICDTVNKSIVLGVATNATDVLTKESTSMLKSFGISPGELRGIGLQMTKLESVKPLATSHRDTGQTTLQFGMEKTLKAADSIEDPIEDAVTPTKPKDTPGRVNFGPEQLNQPTPSRKPLNTMGTQFVLPTQVNETVLEQLPSDIRSKLVASRRRQNQREMSPSTRMGSMRRSTPRKQQTFPGNPGMPKKVPLPPRGRGRPRKFLGREPGNATLPKSMFKPTIHGSVTSDASAAPSDAEFKNEIKARRKGKGKAVERQPANPEIGELDPEFLAALPDDVRNELLAEQRRVQIRKKNQELAKIRKEEEKAVIAARPPKPTLNLPPRPPRQTFTVDRLSTLPDLRDAISKWVEEFRLEGPYEDDVVALGKFLGRLVIDDGDMEKSSQCAKWLDWVVSEELEKGVDAVALWKDAVGKVTRLMQDAVKKRGLGRIRL